MNTKSAEPERAWVDSDDAPEWTEEMFERAAFFAGEALVRPGRAATDPTAAPDDLAPPPTAFQWSRFDALDGRAVHDLLRLRMEVFVVEQRCAFPEIDGRDPDALHLRALDGDRLAGCLRILAEPEGPRIGRIAVALFARGTGLGHRMMEAAVARCGEDFPAQPIELAAQAHLVGFYARHGFTSVGGAYLEDDIPHVDMRRPAGGPR